MIREECDFTSEDLIRALDAMRGFERPWFVAGGWAVDLFLGRVSRPHTDVEIALFREDQSALRRHLVEWQFEKVVRGERAPWPLDEWLAAPVHEIHGRSSSESPGELEFLLNEREGEEWVYRRNAAVRYRASDIGLRSAVGVPFLRPEIVLLYKAKIRGPIDEQDFAAVAGTLGTASRGWLRGALSVCHPGHHCLGVLQGAEA